MAKAIKLSVNTVKFKIGDVVVVGEGINNADAANLVYIGRAEWVDPESAKPAPAPDAGEVLTTEKTKGKK